MAERMTDERLTAIRESIQFGCASGAEEVDLLIELDRARQSETAAQKAHFQLAQQMSRGIKEARRLAFEEAAKVVEHFSDGNTYSSAPFHLWDFQAHLAAVVRDAAPKAPPVNPPPFGVYKGPPPTIEPIPPAKPGDCVMAQFTWLDEGPPRPLPPGIVTVRQPGPAEEYDWPHPTE